MKALFLAAALVLTPMSAMAAPPADNAPITQEEVQARGEICINIMAGKLSADQVITGLQLDTPRKVRDFVLQCHMLNLGVDLGKALAAEDLKTTS